MVWLNNMNKKNISFILHKPQLSENIGACARAIKNFNFNKLILVNPKPIYPNDKVLATSVGAKNIINQSKVFDNLEKSIKNIDIVNTICSILDDVKPRRDSLSYNKLITYVADRPGHDLRYAMDISKMEKELGWIPKETFDTGIRKTIKLYLDNERWWRKIQIDKYILYILKI